MALRQRESSEGPRGHGANRRHPAECGVACVHRPHRRAVCGPRR
jgi:hypothetical protein